MKIAVTGGTGFVGRNIARRLIREGHDVVLIARGLDRTDRSIRSQAQSYFVSAALDNAAKLAQAFSGCEAVVRLRDVRCCRRDRPPNEGRKTIPFFEMP